MNRKQLTLILAAVVVLGGLGLWVRHSQVAGYRPAAGRMGQKVLGDFDVNETVAVRIVNGTNELDLAKQDGKWTVAERDAYPANFGTISEFIRNLGDLKTAQAVEAGESQLGRLELKAPDSDTGGGMLVELKQADGSTLASLLLGKKHLKKPASPSPMGGDEGWPDGRYVMVPGKLDTLSLVSETFANIEPKPDQWLNKDFFKVQKSKRVSVTWPEATNSWTLARETETGTMTLENPLPGETLDTSKAGSVASALGYPSFNDVSKNNPQVEALFTNAVSVKIETFEGFNYDLKAAKSDSGDDYYLTVTVSAAYPRERTPGADEKPEDKEKLDQEFKEKTDKLDEKLKTEQALDGWTYRVSKWTLDTVLKKRSELMKAEDAKETGSTEADPGIDLMPDASALPIVPDLQPIPPPPAPVNATDVIKPPDTAKPAAIEAPPTPPPAPDAKPAESQPADVPAAEAPKPTAETIAVPPVVPPAEPPPAPAPEGN
ncbi:MAG: DUF4340 domain-containing protein [Verrucomicrobiales bacterium]|nr:DUF4340 domain-containing protein [Verrucomicrobiales bacterium]